VETPDTDCAGVAATQDTGPFNIDFEFEDLDPLGSHSVNDVDAGTSYNTPDASCNIAVGSFECTVMYDGDNSGDDQIRVWIDHTGTNSVVEADTTEIQDERVEPGLQPAGTNPLSPFCAAVGTVEEDCTDVVTVSWSAGAPAALDCDDAQGPDTERETNPADEGPNSSETYTCRAFDASGNPTGDADPGPDSETIVVKGENKNDANDPDDSTTYDSPDYSCNIASSGGNFGRCTETVGQDDLEEGTAEICWWIGDDTDGATLCASELTGENQQPDGSDTANDLADQTEITWETRSAGEGEGGLDAEPETATNDTGEDHTITATVYDQFGEPFQGNTEVKFEFFAGSPSDGDGNSPGSPDDSCTTLNSSTCSITYTSTDPGRDLLCVWTNTVPTMTGTNQGGQCNGEGLNDGDDAAGSADAPEPRDDDVDVVSKIWTNPDPATEIDCQPETDQTAVGDEYTATCTATNANGAVPGTEIDAEFTGANDDDGNTKGTPDDSCTTGNGGSCQITHNPGGGGETGKTLYRAWNDEDYTNGSSEADNSEGRNEGAKPGATAEPDNTDVVSNQWVDSGDRNISIHKSKNSVERGKSVRIFGEIDANSNDCEVGENVKLKARRPGGNFKTIASQITNGAGEYSFQVKVFRTKDYKAQAPQHNGCDKATSRTIRVRQT
jgi:hypothetical protein